MSVEEARGALRNSVMGKISGTAIEHRQKLNDIMKAADAYANAKALAAHVDACGARHSLDGETFSACGDGWYCDKANATEQLGTPRAVEGR